MMVGREIRDSIWFFLPIGARSAEPDSISEKGLALNSTRSRYSIDTIDILKLAGNEDHLYVVPATNLVCD